MRKKRRHENIKIVLSILVITFILAFGLSFSAGIIGGSSQAFAGQIGTH